LGSRGSAHPQPGAGGNRAAETLDHLRGRRAGARVRWAVRLVQRHGGGSRREPLARQGRGVDLRPRDPGRARVRASREALAAGMRPALAARLNGLYARSVYLPATILGQSWRRTSRRLRGVARGQPTSLPVAGWRDLFPAQPIALAQPRKNAGDVNLAELAVLA